ILTQNLAQIGLRQDGVGMSRSQLVAEHLPLLRRYARALTGNQASGDAYVGAMLEALLQDHSLLDEQHGPRAGLFRLFTQIWKTAGPLAARRAARPARRPVPAVYADLEFGLAQ